MQSLPNQRLAPSQRRSARALRAAADQAARRVAIEMLESRLHLSVTMLTSRTTTPSANPASITAVNGTGYFTTIDNTGVNHLWKTDGTDAGTVQTLSFTGAGNSVPKFLTPSNGRVFFSASGGFESGQGSTATQLYVTDGTVIGTTQLTQYPSNGGGVQNPIDVNGRVFFLGNLGNFNPELWTSDGTVAGTKQLATWPQGTTGVVASSFANENGTLYFLANDATHGTELWKSDGTVAGTGIVADINPGTGSSGVANLTYINGAVYFTANDGTHGTELWKTDGTAAGTALVKDINPGAASSSPTSLTAYNGLLYFAGNDGVHGTELWQSDGTAGGTVMLADINPGTAGSNPGNLVVAGGTLYLTADDGTHGVELWKTDGTTAGTTLVKDINPVLSATGGDGSGSSPTLLTNVNGRLFFSANDGTHGAELWTSDGTTARTKMVADIDPGAAGSSIASPMAFGSQLVFIANDGVHGAELWASDGTAAGTTLLKDIYFGSTSSNPAGFANIGGKLLFAATSADTGNELWTTDGTPAGTYQVKNLTGIINGMNPRTLVPFGDRLVFQSGGRLWVSDGTTAGTVQIGTGGIDGSFGGLTYANVGGELFFASGNNLWKTDGTAAGTMLVRTMDSSPTNSNFIDNFNSVNGRLYFQGYSNTAGEELWTSDGTTGGTYMVADLTPGTGSSSIFSMTGLGGNLIFGANGVLYRSDGTATGTVPLAAKFNSSIGYNFGTFTNLDGVLIFQATSATNGALQLWRSDGTAAGTRQLAVGSTINQVVAGASVLNGVEYFFVIDTSGNYGLWRTDGTDAGTVLVKSFGTTQYEGGLLTINGSLYFRGPGGNALWKSDGTPAGTSQVMSFAPSSAFISPLVNSVGTLYFTVNSRVYTSDGTAAGTILADVATPQPSMENVLTALGDQAFFAGTTTQFGNQLWVITPANVPSAPSAPATFSASAVSGGEIDLSWSAVGNALAYQLQRSTDPAFGTVDFTVFVRDPLTTSYSDRTASPGVTYYYRIAADNRGGLSAYSAAPASTPATPNAPSGLAANPFPNHIDLSWTDTSANESGFKIERSFNPNFTSIDATFTVAANITAFSDTGILPLNVYFYRVTAFNAAGSSGAATAVVFSPDLAPTQPVATRVSASEVDLQWFDNSSTELGFRIFRSLAGGGTPALLTTLAAKIVSYSDTTAAANVSYSYVIEQYGPYGFSDSVPATCLSAAPALSTSVAQLPGLFLPSGNAFPTAVVTSNGIGFFAETDSNGFTELWRTDGTAAGTTLISTNIVSGNAVNTVGNSMVDMNGILYFVGTDPSSQTKALCRSDGTAAGTFPLIDLSPSGNTTIHNLTVLNGVLYFRASAVLGGTDDALWKSDGTAAGTVLVKDFGGVAATGLSYNPMISVNGKLLLSAASTGGITTLYVSDGTAAGTVQVLPATGPMNVENLKKVGNGAYFMNGNTFKLWFTDGTAAGTFEVPGSPGLANLDDQFTDVGGKLFFAANAETLWTSDGTAAGTHAVASLPQLIRPIAAFNGECVFATSGSTSSTVFATTGDPSSTSTIASFTSDVNMAGISQLVVYGGNLYFSVEQSGRQWLLEKTDGTLGGTATVFTYSASNPPANFSVFNNLLLFAADDGYNGSQLWRSDGTAAGTSMIKNLDLIAMTAQPDWMTTVNGVVFFASSTSDNPNLISSAPAPGADTPMELWKTDGTAAGTTRLAFVGPSNLVGVGNTLYFSGFTQPTGTELWKSDGTAAGTVMVADIAPGSASSGAMPLTGLNGILLFGVPVNTTGDYQLWRSDGSATGTFQVSPALLHLYTKAENQPGPDFAVSNGVFYFVGSSGGTGNELWRSDGTAAGTSIVSDIVPGAAGSNPADFVDVNGTLYFAAQDPSTTARDLYRSDGTPAGTVPVATVGSNIQSITNVNNTVFFVGTDAAHGAELWSSAGGTTAIVSDIVPGTNGSSPFGLTAVGNTLYFVAQTTSSPNTTYLFKTDGSAAGTVPVRPYQVYGLPFGLAPAPSFFMNVNGTLFYSDGVHLWSSDGTVAGTLQVMTTGIINATPTLFAGPQAAVLGDNFIFGSAVKNLGRELRVAAATPPAAPSGLSASLTGGLGVVTTRAIRAGASAVRATLTWVSYATNAVGFIVYRSTDPAFTMNVITTFVPAGTLSYADNAVVPGTRYYYEVRAVNAAGMSAPSNVISIVSRTTVAAWSASWGPATAPLFTTADGLHLLPAGRAVDVPWSGITKINLTLANPSALTAADVSLSSAAGVNYGPVTVSGSGTSFTITLARPVTVADRLTITIGNVGIAPLTRELDVLPGDITDDGIVGFADYVIISNNLGLTYGANAWTQGDCTGDGVVGLADYTVVSNDFGNSLPPLPPSPAAGIATRATRTTLTAVTASKATGTLWGTVFADVNRNGVQDANETGLSGWRVFIDSNHDGVWESNEASVLTDQNGKYVFKNLAAGTYWIGEAAPAARGKFSRSKTTIRATLLTGSTLHAGDFANRLKEISGAVVQPVL